MIIVSIRGGLGNQLFQYAAARSVALRRSVPLKLDLSWYKSAEERAGMTSRAFELSHFNVSATEATFAEIASVRDQQGPTGILARGAVKLGLARRRGWIKERKYFEFDRTVLNAARDAYLDGYWQNERYFAPIAKVIRGEFCLVEPLSGKAAEVRAEIENCESIGVHVRRGDYVDGTSAIHSVCDVDYYVNGIEAASHGLSNPRYFYFSDDPEWVSSYLGNRLPGKIVSDGSSLAHEELTLMAACRRQVIANSTFSWWAAWLNPNPGKVVIAPRRWFTGDAFDISGLLPGSWRII